MLCYVLNEIININYSMNSLNYQCSDKYNQQSTFGTCYTTLCNLYQYDVLSYQEAPQLVDNSSYQVRSGA